jgi:hypothetical protein
MSYQHTAHCIQETARSNQAIEAYKRAWPNYCQHCNGEGVITTYEDPSPPGVALGSGFYRFDDPCEQCTEKGLCPRCGSVAWHIVDPTEIPEIPCTTCGWSWGKNEGDVMPAPYECSCYELAAQAWTESQADQDYYQRVLRGEE